LSNNLIANNDTFDIDIYFNNKLIVKKGKVLDTKTMNIQTANAPHNSSFLIKNSKDSFTVLILQYKKHKFSLNLGNEITNYRVFEFKKQKLAQMNFGDKEFSKFRLKMTDFFCYMGLNFVARYTKDINSRSSYFFTYIIPNPKHKKNDKYGLEGFWPVHPIL